MGTRWMSPERFYAKAVRDGACLIWQGKGRIGPYGTAGYQSTQWLAHRLSYFFAHGDAPAVVRHTCDTPLCIEPRHLIAGEHADNVRDKVERRRHRFGDTHPRRKLSSTEAAELRSLHAAGSRQIDLAARFGLSKQQVSKIVRELQWREPA